MKSSTKIALMLLSAAALPAASHALAGQETRNGGNVILMEDGKTYELADLHFKSDETGRLSLDREMRFEIERLAVGLELILELRHEDGDGNDFFKHAVLGPYAEFRLTEQLPEDCSFVRASELPLPKDATLAPAGCTLEGVTYLRPSVYHQLPLQQQMLLVLHERMHAFNGRMALAHKMELIQAYSIILEKFFPAYVAALRSSAPDGDAAFSLTNDELQILNRLSTNTRRLISATAPSRRATELTFTRDGGILRSRNVPGQTPLPLWQLDSQQVRLHVGSFIEQGPHVFSVAGYAGGYGGSIRGPIELRRSQWSFRGKVDISGVGSTINGVRIHGFYHESPEPLRIVLKGVQWRNVKMLKLPAGLKSLQIGGEYPGIQTIDGLGQSYEPKHGQTVLQVAQASDWQKIMGEPLPMVRPARSFQ
jgi:hypothetical protein